jgi:general secretion pathway protein D
MIKTRLVSCFLALALACTAAPSQAAESAGVVINMRDLEIADVAAQISRITGRTLVLDPTVKGTVNVVSAEPLAPQSVWDLFVSVLRVHGFVAVRSGQAWRIVPQSTSSQAAAAPTPARPQGIVTRLVVLKNLPAETAVRVIKPLLAPFGSVEGLAAPNAIVVTDYAETVARIETVARSLDGAGGSALDAIVLRNASAKDVGEALGRILTGEGVAGAPRIAIDERSNTILLRGSTQALAEARRAAALLDAPGGAAPTTRVFRLNFGDAEKVADVLRGVLIGQASSTAAVNPVAAALASTASAPSPASAPPFGVAGAIRSASGETSIQAAPELNAIVVRGAPSAIASVGDLIAQLDVRRPQVMIEAAIVEITGEDGEQLGVQLGGKGTNLVDGTRVGSSFTNGPGLSLKALLTAIGAPTGQILSADGATLAVGRDGDFGLLVQALGQSNKANLLSTPSVTTLDNQPAEIVVGQNVPFRTGSFTTDGQGASNPFVTIERQDVGITLKVVPRVHEGDVVRLQVRQEVSSLTNGNVAGAADLVTNRRSIDTTVLADNGQVIVLGGLITDDRSSSNNRVPLLGDIPGVGKLFRASKEAQTKRTLFIFLRPTILRDRDAVAQTAQDRYERLRQQEQAPNDGRVIILNPPGTRLAPAAEDLF